MMLSPTRGIWLGMLVGSLAWLYESIRTSSPLPKVEIPEV
jgi:hypothetical protein